MADGRGRAGERRAGGLPERLRAATADLHREVERAADLPGSVRDRDDYVDLLGRFHDLFAPLETRLGTGPWKPGWVDVGVELPAHRRAHLLLDDLAHLGARPPRRPVHLPQLASFGQALGCLYVLEGSALGGSVLAPAFRRTLGDLPTRFLIGDGRPVPAPWRSVRSALSRFDESGGGCEDVVVGARQTFIAFGRHLCGRASVGVEAG